MGRLRSLRRWLTARDPNLTFDQRLARWVNVAAAAGVVVTAGGWVMGWLLNLPWFLGLLLGLVAWVLILNGFVASGRRSLRPTGASAEMRVSRVPAAEKLDELSREVQEMKSDLRRSEQERERLEAEKEALKGEAKPTVWLHQLSDEDLRGCCLKLSEDMHQFLNDHAWDEIARSEARDADLYYEMARADKETMHRFRTHLRPIVMRTLAELKRRGWWKHEDFDLADWEAVEGLAHPRDLQLIADRLERLGYDF